jgi:hypothetical protein
MNTHQIAYLFFFLSSSTFCLLYFTIYICFFEYMSSESKPLLSTVPTRQNYLAFPETLDPLYHKPNDASSIHSCISQSLCQALSDDDDESSIAKGGRRISRDSKTETLHYHSDNDNGSKAAMRPPTDSIAYIQRMERFFDLFSTSLYLENNVAVARDHLGMYFICVFLQKKFFWSFCLILISIILSILANERTYLAWVRTSLSTISIGVGKCESLRKLPAQKITVCLFFNSYHTIIPS